jgi:hypothetical protein
VDSIGVVSYCTSFIMMVCCAVLCCAVLCCAVLCCADVTWGMVPALEVDSMTCVTFRDLGM